MSYMTAAEAYEAECEVHAKRHEANAVRHVAEGHPPEFAEGSLRKAAKWRAKAEKFKSIFAIPLPPHLEAAYEKTREAIAKNLFGS
jgi:hypothetical protein